eukprot:CAMPEP_0176098148 /NCGR_PEP_ID=MMETSP0120_2-20121206/49210_1 /TAXON_ID=160619 /ORGANISM="Kryptoperidinium foliaceum, Strain CCMP 1326" /LENGTH=72 /DNA_ID=CAMNT_0017432153 /DNA_START=36 /DNA_END=251 /DNA_ORIENTATION=+
MPPHPQHGAMRKLRPRCALREASSKLLAFAADGARAQLNSVRSGKRFQPCSSPGARSQCHVIPDVHKHYRNN